MGANLVAAIAAGFLSCGSGYPTMDCLLPPSPYLAPQVVIMAPPLPTFGSRNPPLVVIGAPPLYRPPVVPPPVYIPPPPPAIAPPPPPQAYAPSPPPISWEVLPRDQARDWIINQGEAFCRKFPQDKICHRRTP
jgi:hypothetical protein